MRILLKFRAKGVAAASILTLLAGLLATPIVHAAMAVSAPVESTDGIDGSEVVTPLSSKDVNLFTDGLGNYLLVPRVAVTSADGRKSFSYGDNIFFGQEGLLFNADYKSARLGGGYLTVEFADGGLLSLRRENKKVFEVAFHCDSKTIALVEVTEGVDAFLAATRLVMVADYKVIQIYALKKGNYLVVDEPRQNATVASRRFWYGEPGQMRRITEDVARPFARSGTPLIKYLPALRWPWDPKPPKPEFFGIPGLDSIEQNNSVCRQF